MALTINQLVDLIADAETTRTATEQDLADAEALVAELSVKVQELRDEEKSFRAAMARRFPEHSEELISQPVAAAAAGEAQSTSWITMARTDAVEKAISMIYQYSRFASPDAISAVLANHGRNDNKDEIGGSTARLNKVGRIHSIGRGKWVPGPAPEKTPGDTADTVPPGFVTTERPGGDGHAAGPDSVPDHDPTFGGRDDRDQYRETEDPVAVDF